MGLDPGLDWTREQGEPEQEQGRDLAQGRDTFATGDRDREGERGSPLFTNSSSFSNNTNHSPASNGNDDDDEQQGPQSRCSLTSSPLPVAGPSILCGSSSFSTQGSTPVNGVSASWSFLNPSTFDPDLFLQHHFECLGTHKLAINVIPTIDLVGPVTTADM